MHDLVGRLSSTPAVAIPAALDGPHCSARDIEDHLPEEVYDPATHCNKESDSENESAGIESTNDRYRGEGVNGLIPTLPPATGNAWVFH